MTQALKGKEALARSEELPKKVGDALITIKKSNPKEAQEINNYLVQIKDKDITILGQNEMLNLTDNNGEIRAFKRTVYLSAKEGTLVQPVPGGPHVVSAQGYEKLNEGTGTIVMNADSVIVDGTKQQNPHVVRDKKNGRILAIYARSLAFRYSPLGIPQVSDRTTVFDVPAYRLIDLLAKAKKFPQAFVLLPTGQKPEIEKGETWASYPFDESTVLWIDTSHNEALTFYSQIINREKKAIDFAQTFAQRNAAKHLHGLQKAPGAEWTVSVICWRPQNDGPMRWDTARYMTTQKALTDLADGKTHGELPQIDLVKGKDYISDEPEAAEAETEPDEQEEGTKKTTPEAAEREEPDNPVWAQLDAVPGEFIAAALVSLGWGTDPHKVGEAKELMNRAVEIADGGGE